jgi:hypothetical protein
MYPERKTAIETIAQREAFCDAAVTFVRSLGLELDDLEVDIVVL